MDMHKFLRAVWACCLFLPFASCSESDEAITPPDPVSYTMLVYMAADNSMDSEVDYTISQLKYGARRSAGTVVVYVDRESEAPRLFRITQQGDEVPLKSYEEENSASPATLARVIRETKELVPSSRFGLVLWSHSMGWLPVGYSSSLVPRSTRSGTQADFPRTRYIGIDNHPGNGGASSVAMEIDALADALPDGVAEYIWFDVCLMGCIEGLYEMRNKADYMIASPTEVLAEAGYNASGIPYASVLPFLFGGVDDLKQACATYFNHYNGMGHDILRSATVTLVDAAELNGLFIATQNILQGRLRDMETLDTSVLQAYHTDNVPNVFFDMGDAVRTVAEGRTAEFDAQLRRTVIYKAATPQFINKISIYQEHFSGLSMYVPLSGWKGNYEYGYYFNSLEWSGIYNAGLTP